MSDIFISYKREEQPAAKQLAHALEREGWTVWWDPKLRAGERFDDVIEAALQEAKCVIVMWSRRSVKSRYVKDEASYALRRNKLAPVAIEAVDLPFRFEGLHTPELIDWDGSEHHPAFRGLVDDIAAIIGPPAGRGGEPLVPTERERVPAPERPRRALEPGTVFRDTLRDSSHGPEMVVVPAGSFEMGDVWDDGREEEKPVHTVRIRNPFALGRYPVTFDEYGTFAEATGRAVPEDKGWGRGRRPVIRVSWEDAVAYAEWLCGETGKPYRLPSEAEWEYAARSGGKKEKWAGRSDEAKSADYAWHADNSGGQTHPVGEKKPNGLGLHDMSGNVWEWVQDCWHDNYDQAPQDGSAWLEESDGNCALRVLRGGSWLNAPWTVRSASRDRYAPDLRHSDVGFRLARDLRGCLKTLSLLQRR